MASDPLLEARGLIKHFGGVHAIDGLNFHIQHGEILGIIGPNGSGKTTLFNVLTGFLKANSGDVLFEGEHITNLLPHVIAKRGIIRTFQLNMLFSSLTVLENVRFAYHLRRKNGVFGAFLNSPSVQREERTITGNAELILEQTGMADRRDQLAGQLSYGWQKTLTMAIGLASKPKLLLLDEPLTGISHSRIDAIAGLVNGARDNGMTICVIEHNVHLLMSLCDRIVALNFGQKMAEGKPEDVTNDKVVVESYIGR